MAIIRCSQVDIDTAELLVYCILHAQVSRTDANALLALDPVDLAVTKKFTYTSILPEAKVSKVYFTPRQSIIGDKHATNIGVARASNLGLNILMAK